MFFVEGYLGTSDVFCPVDYCKCYNILFQVVFSFNQSLEKAEIDAILFCFVLYFKLCMIVNLCDIGWLWHTHEQKKWHGNIWDGKCPCNSCFIGCHNPGLNIPIPKKALFLKRGIVECDKL